MILQNYGSAENPQSFTGFTLNFTGNTADGEALVNTTEPLATRAYYVYQDIGGVTSTENQPKVNMN